MVGNNGVVSIHLTHHQDVIQLTGTFSSAVLSIQSKKKQVSHLRHIERAYPLLKGLSTASIQAPLPSKLLLGQSLGMLFVELTSRCNERCLHCYAESSPERNDFLSAEEIQQSLRQARQLGRPFVQFTGGDPLIHRDLLGIIAYAASLDFQGMEIYTNGLLLSDTLLEKLSNYQLQFSFSIYADNAKMHDAITRVNGSWEKTLSAMRRSMAQGFKVRVGVVVMCENAEAVLRMPDFLNKTLGLAIEDIRFDPVNAVGRGTATELPAHIQVSPSHAEKGKIRRGKLCIAANGDVYPCIFSRQLRLGNVRQQSLEEILNSLLYQDDQKYISQRWKQCNEQLSCSDCQMIACLLKSNVQPRRLSENRDRSEEIPF
ncbi:MAG: radical SAM protein [Mariprofundaceae bacterium]|nr:radical SAM protein [Mariprofundaceae bacterium]